ncbi:uncharacterized protein LOC117648228 [Thrips palmi]|uniref:Uncharacterized protein LOC117648228 n=1 Tax=Thrips palmi TaxID=161013 RepID=A0A6P8Z7X5_THRPL|nr:uncharacterized protein LOC117648228 [Thrips palmi]
MATMTFKDYSVLQRYQESIKKIRRFGLNSNLSEREVNNAMDQCLRSLLDKENESKSKTRKYGLFSIIQLGTTVLKKLAFVSLVCLVTGLVLYGLLQHKPIQYFIQSNLQDFIYPGMKILRKLSLPLISLCPSLTKFYDESCLVVNPFFRVPDMPCPCEDVRAVLNLTGENLQQEQYHSGIPFLVKVDRVDVSWESLKSLYLNNSIVFDRDASQVTISRPSSHGSAVTPNTIFNMNWDESDREMEQSHIQWRCNRMEPARLLRSVFGVPSHEPTYAAGVTIEKLLMIDGPKAPLYRLPTTDGTTVFIQQSSGSRIIILTPAHECKEKCSAVSVDLPSGHILWFSWWYWRASSLPSPTAISMGISYVGSYL